MEERSKERSCGLHAEAYAAERLFAYMHPVGSLCSYSLPCMACKLPWTSNPEMRRVYPETDLVAGERLQVVHAGLALAAASHASKGAHVDRRKRRLVPAVQAP